MITSDWSNRGPSELPAKSPSSSDSAYGAIVHTKNGSFRLPPSSVRRADKDELTFFRVTLDENTAKEFLASAAFSIQIDAPRVAGLHNGGGLLRDIDRKMIALAFRNCI